MSTPISPDLQGAGKAQDRAPERAAAVTSASIAARLDRLPLGRWHRKVLALFGAGALSDNMDMYVSGPVLAVLVSIGWSNNGLNATFISVTMAGYFIGALMSGYLGDNYGRRKAFLYNVVIFSVSTTVAVFSVNMTMLIACRFVMGVGLGAALPAMYGSLGEYIPVSNRGKYSSYIGLIANFSPPIMTLLALVLVPSFTWRSLFVVLAVFGWAVFVALWRFLPESPRWLAERGRLAEADEAVTKVERDLEKEKHVVIDPIEPEAADMAGAVAPGEEAKSSYRQLFTGGVWRRTLTISVLLIGMNVAVYTFTNWIPTMFVDRGIDVKKSLAMTAAMLVGAPVGVFLLSLVANRLPRKIGSIVLVLAVGATGYVYSLQTNMTAIVVWGFVLYVVLYGYSLLACSVYIGELFPTRLRLRGAGFGNAMGRIAAVVMPPIIASLLSKHGEASVFALVFAILVVVAAVVALAGVETAGKTLESVNEEVLGD